MIQDTTLVVIPLSTKANRSIANEKNFPDINDYIKFIENLNSHMLQMRELP